MRKPKAIIDLVIIFYDIYFYQVYSELFADFYGFMSNPLKVRECHIVTRQCTAHNSCQN